MAIYFQHVGERGGERDFPKTIGTYDNGLKRYSLNDLNNMQAQLTDTERATLDNILQKETPSGFQLWGIPSGAKSVIKSLRRNDWLLLLVTDRPGGCFYYVGRVIHLLERENFGLSSKLWGEPRFPLIILLDGTLTSYAWEQFRDAFGYKQNWRLAGNTYRLTDERIALSQFSSEAQIISAITGKLDIISDSFNQYIDPVEMLYTAREGQLLLREHVVRERNADLVKKFKNSLSSFKCTVCGFDFGQTYGKIGRGFIEAHHVEPIASKTASSITKLDDLIAVCSNCHRMLHRKYPPYSADEIRTALVDALDKRY